MASKGSNVRLLRGIIRELRRTNGQKSVKNLPAFQYVLDQFRAHQVTSEKICRGQNQQQHLAQTYLTLLESVRKYEELSSVYRGRERSLQESANLVGLGLPEAPVPPNIK